MATVGSAAAQSHMAGEIVFQRLDRLLQRRDPFTSTSPPSILWRISWAFRAGIEASPMLARSRNTAASYSP